MSSKVCAGRTIVRFLSKLAVASMLALGVASAWASRAIETDLDVIARRTVAEEGIVGASVLIARGDRIFFHRSYGFADLELEVPSKPDTIYRIVGPMLPLTGVAVMQQVEQGKLSLDDDISKYLPEFPTGGRRVTIRELLNFTSGIVDYHYLGDPLEATYGQPKALDEIMDLFSRAAWVNEPGTKWDWSISNFHLLIMILERISGQSYDDYMAQNILIPAGATSTTYCGDSVLVRGLARGYDDFGAGHVPNHHDAMAANYDLRYCSSVTDLFRLWRAVRKGVLLRPATLHLMSTPTEATIHISARDPQVHFGLALILGHEDEHASVGLNGSLLGYSGSLYDYPDDDLTVAVLTNTTGQNALALAKALTRRVLGLAPVPAPPSSPMTLGSNAPVTLADIPTMAQERARFAGTFLLGLEEGHPGYHDSFRQYRRTYRVFDENGRLMIEALGDVPERLLKQPDGTFRIRSAPRDPVVLVEDHQTVVLKLRRFPGLSLSGERTGPADLETFHRRLHSAN
jgi:CubicO group peptidase (beta-lactamase class C family)